ncbi:GM15185 [Drosophila sechellia]|uniref:GM15185 n=1 Tax=Drosophila sechellia TaxID=7238 RepID=B4IBQ8_DROSE|nr:GM15185 [Drosophila sechellia]
MAEKELRWPTYFVSMCGIGMDVITVASDGWRWEIAEIAEVPTAEVPTEIFAQEQKQKLARIKFERRCVPKEALPMDGRQFIFCLQS